MLTPELPQTRMQLAMNATAKVATRVVTKCPRTSVAMMAAPALAPATAAMVPARVLYEPPLSDSAPLKPPKLIQVAAPARSSNCPAASGMTVANEARMPAAYAGRVGDRKVAPRSACRARRKLAIRKATPRAPATAWRAQWRRQSIGLSLPTISARRDSRKGGNTTFSPSVASLSSTPKPGPSDAISNRMPFGSRK